MQLYRLDSASGPVTDLLGPCLYRTRTVARERGAAEAKARSEDVTLTKITNSGRLVPSLVIAPTGKARRLTF